jgi:hypothetical protein
MRLEVSQVQGNGFVEVTARHGDESLVWQSKAYSKVKLPNPSKVFDEINAYWEWAGPETQQKVWDCYVKIKEILRDIVDNMYVAQHVRFYVNEMYKAMPMASFMRWLLTVGNLFIPSDVQDKITKDSRYTRTEQTYLRPDYINLATVALAVRPMLPLWGEYIEQASDDDLHKEMEAVGLIAETELMTWPQPPQAAMSAFDKLNAYIRFCTEDTPITLGKLWSGMGSSEIIDWLQSKVIVRRLTIVPLCDHTSHSIISNVYRYAKSNIKPVDRSTTDRVNEKRPEGGGGEEDDKTSFLESYKIKQRIADGDAVMFSVATENMAGLVQTVDPTIDLNLLLATSEHIEEMGRCQINPHQIILAQWVMAKAFPPRAFYHIPKMSVVRLLATTQALLWHWGFHELAIYMQVDMLQQSDQMLAGLTKAPKSGSRIANKYKEELALLFPHVKPQRVRQNDDPDSRSDNMAALAINTVTAEIRSSTWEYHGPRELYRVANQPEGRNILVVSTNLKNSITELVIHLAKLNQ